MNKFKLLAMAALVAGVLAGAAPAEARHVKMHGDSTMQNEYGFQKDMKGNKAVKDKLKHKHKHKKKMKKAKKMKHAGRHGTTPNECTNPPCGHNYDR